MINSIYVTMEQKHFRYEGKAAVKVAKDKGEPNPKPQDIEVKGVEFFVPVRVYMKVDGEDVYESAHIDYANKKLFFEDKRFNTDEAREKVFMHLFQATNPPERMYEAGDEIYDQVDRAQREFDEVNAMKEGSPCQTE